MCAKYRSKTPRLTYVLCGTLSIAAWLGATTVAAKDTARIPADVFDLSHWKIDLPLDKDGNSKADTIDVKALQSYSHPDFFFLDDEGRMVFTSPNKATTTPNSTNARSELRYMIRGQNTRIKTHSAANNFAVEARKDSDKFGSIGGKMDATLRVDHVARNAALPEKKAVYSVVVGQIHSINYKKKNSQFGHGNEPLKIFYKKFPDHKTGSVFWTYERNHARGHPDRRDIDYTVWGKAWDDPTDPGADGIKLGQDFSYTVNVYKNTMYLTFKSDGKATRKFAVNLARNITPDGVVDAKDNPNGYGGDHLYFKAGAYNQCSTKNTPGLFYPACAGTGVWEIDKAAGDYVQVRFSKLTVGPSTPPSL